MNPTCLLITLEQEFLEPTAVAAGHQCSENLEGLWSSAALSRRLFHCFRGRSDRVNWAKRFWQIHVAPHSGRERRSRRGKRSSSKAPAAQLRGAGVSI